MVFDLSRQTGVSIKIGRMQMLEKQPSAGCQTHLFLEFNTPVRSSCDRFWTIALPCVVNYFNGKSVQDNYKYTLIGTEGQ